MERPRPPLPSPSEAREAGDFSSSHTKKATSEQHPSSYLAAYIVLRILRSGMRMKKRVRENERRVTAVISTVPKITERVRGVFAHTYIERRRRKKGGGGTLLPRPTNHQLGRGKVTERASTAL